MPKPVESLTLEECRVHYGNAVDLIDQHPGPYDLIVTDPPYAFGNDDKEHAVSASVAIALRDSARCLRRGGWMVVMCAASARSALYMVESVRGIVTPVRFGTWCKPRARTKARTPGWAWASVTVVVFRRGRAQGTPTGILDHITAEPVMNGRRAELPPEVARWMVEPFAMAGGLMLDPFAGSGALLRAATSLGMRAVGFESDTGAVYAERVAEARE